ncbi:MAG: hypothetical protein RBG13Loki_1511 [Promethearchaeota archaeon CR_4]|nr:MAG: hypothetical protein RBG13Loki_1511 [Candidatus Lokiarchaeota archaeon CR_4]
MTITISSTGKLQDAAREDSPATPLLTLVKEILADAARSGAPATFTTEQ